MSTTTTLQEELLCNISDGFYRRTNFELRSTIVLRADEDVDGQVHFKNILGHKTFEYL